jgi:RHS repeat-associated protein
MRRFAWDEENRLKSSVDNRIAVNYKYDSSGERTVKYSSSGESLYFSEYYAMNKDYTDYRTSKNIYLGETRLATRLGNESGTSTGYADVNTYYYHSDHLGSAQLMTDYRGEEYEHIEYTSYGELWIERKSDSFDKIPFRFTGKEYDEETGLYYYSARYLSPKNSRWMSADPAGSELINPNRENFNLLEGTNWYSYVSNNPVKYTDPTGMKILGLTSAYKMNEGSWKGDSLGGSSATIGGAGCTVTAWTNIINTENGNLKQTPGTVGGKDSKFMDGSSLRTRESAYNTLTGNSFKVTHVKNDISNALSTLDSSSNNYYVTGRADISYKDKLGNIITVNHEINITGINLDKNGKILSVDFQGTSTHDDKRSYQLTPIDKGTIGIGQITQIFYVQSSKKNE